MPQKVSFLRVMGVISNGKRPENGFLKKCHFLSHFDDFFVKKGKKDPKNRLFGGFFVFSRGTPGES